MVLLAGLYGQPVRSFANDPLPPRPAPPARSDLPAWLLPAAATAPSPFGAPAAAAAMPYGAELAAPQQPEEPQQPSKSLASLFAGAATPPKRAQRRAAAVARKKTRQQFSDEEDEEDEEGSDRRELDGDSDAWESGDEKGTRKKENEIGGKRRNRDTDEDLYQMPEWLLIKDRPMPQPEPRIEKILAFRERDVTPSELAADRKAREDPQNKYRRRERIALVLHDVAARSSSTREKLRKVAGIGHVASPIAKPQSSSSAEQPPSLSLEPSAAAQQQQQEERKEETIHVQEYLVKEEGKSYLWVDWWTQEEMVARYGDKHAVDKIKRFMLKRHTIEARNIDLFDGAPFDIRHLNAERVIARHEYRCSPDTPGAYKAADGTWMAEEFWVKWEGLSYKEATWETRPNVASDIKIGQYMRTLRPPATVIPCKEKYYDKSPKFKNNHELRDYQIQGLNWLIKNYHEGRSCILADEMGLGKTVQCVSFLNHLYSREGIPGPFLVVVPLSTLGHWKREFEEWTDMNCLIYYDSRGGKETRKLIRQTEFYRPGEGPGCQPRFNVLVTSYEVGCA